MGNNNSTQNNTTRGGGGQEENDDTSSLEGAFSQGGGSSHHSTYEHGPVTQTVPIPGAQSSHLNNITGGGVGGGRGGGGGEALEPALVPVAITWTQGGSVVEVEGSFDGWQTRTQLHRSGNREFSVIKSFPPGVYQYKFIVDGEWMYAPDQPAMYDEMGNVNNVLEVQEYVPEILDNLDHFAVPSSPKESYDDYLFYGEDFSKEPPAMPPQLKLTLLNMPPIPYAPNLLPRPQHVVLNHAYVDQSKANQGLSVIGTTHRYRAKYVTIVLMKSSNSQDC